MKKNINSIKPIQSQTKDMLLTAKRCKKKYNPINSPS